MHWRDRLLLLSIPALLLPSSSAMAEQPTSGSARTLFGRPVPAPKEVSPEEYERRRAAFQAHLEENDLVLSGDVLMPRARLENPEGPVADHDGTWHDEPHRATIFLNFFGGMLSGGTNAAEGQSACINNGVPVDYPAYEGNEATALAMIQVFEAAMEPYGVRIRYEEIPPKHLPYSQVMMGGQPQDIGIDQGALGVSCSSDCGDYWWRDTTFAFTAVGGDATTLGNTALQEAAHAFGLDHIDGSNNIMYPVATGGAKGWAQECTTYNDSTGGIGCQYIHEVFCPEGGAQNDHAELLAYFGENSPDVEPPVVTLLSPADGAEIEAGGSVSISVEVSDDHEGVGWRLAFTPEGQETVYAYAYMFETSWELTQLPEGAHTIRVEAIDHDLNEGSAEVTIFVGVDAPADSSGGGTDEGEESGSPDESGDEGNDDASDEEEGSGDAGQDDGGATDRGCACDVQSAPSFGWLAFGLLGFGLRRRRRA